MEAVACGLIIHVDCSLNSEKGRGRRPWWSARQKGGESEMRLEVEERCGAHLSLRSAIRPNVVGSGKLPEQRPHRLLQMLPYPLSVRQIWRSRSDIADQSAEQSTGPTMRAREERREVGAPMVGPTFSTMKKML
jgi:hypothetical protein